MRDFVGEQHSPRGASWLVLASAKYDVIRYRIGARVERASRLCCKLTGMDTYMRQIMTKTRFEEGAGIVTERLAG